MVDAVGFCWTFPVPEQGFIKLSPRINQAAKQSLTIRYQYEVIRRHAEKEGYRLIRVVPFLEVEPDHGTRYIVGELKKVWRTCKDKDAILLLVDLSEASGGWRGHTHLRAWAKGRTSKEKVEWISPDQIVIDGQFFDPGTHFRAWRKRREEWIADKAKRAKKVLRRALPLCKEEYSYSKIADILNDEDLSTPQGKKWTKSNLAKFLKDRTADDAT